MTLHPRTNQTNRYPLFSEIFNDVPFSSVLDFGGNSGNLLHFSNGDISEQDYICIDPSVPAINSGANEFPQATFHHYDKYNYMYNHSGSTSAVLPTVPDIDIIWAYSVFSHTDLHELYTTVKWMMSLNPKKIAVSILDMDTPVMLQYFYNKRVADYGECEDIRVLIDSTYDIVYLVDNNQVIVNTPVQPKVDCAHFIAFYRLQFIIDYFAARGITINISRPGDGYIPFLVI